MLEISCGLERSCTRSRMGPRWQASFGDSKHQPQKSSESGCGLDDSSRRRTANEMGTMLTGREWVAGEAGGDGGQDERWSAACGSCLWSIPQSERNVAAAPPIRSRLSFARRPVWLRGTRAFCYGLCLLLLHSIRPPSCYQT